MEIKKPKWSDCVFSPGSSTQPHKPGEPFSWTLEIKAGTHISAKYGESDVKMEVVEVQQGDNFLAKIKYFEPMNVAKPTDLSEGDCVQINREHICWISDRLNKAKGE
jgi:hypothetical protein